jgi:hypothetical protein
MKWRNNVSRLKQSIGNSFLDEERVLRKIERRIAKRRKISPTKTLLSMMAATVILALLIGMSRLMAPTNVVAGVLTLDMKPSLRIEVAKDFTVLNALAQNSEAASLNLSSLKGLPIQDALKEFISMAHKAGYLDNLAITSKYLLVTTISLNGKDETFNLDLKQIITQMQKEETLTPGVQVAVMEAKKQDLHEAQETKTPLWMYVLSDKKPDSLSTATSNVQSYFEDTSLKDKFETEYGKVLEDQHKPNTEDIEEALDELSEKGVDVSAYRTRLTQSGVDLNQLKTELLVLLEDLDTHDEEKAENSKAMEEKNSETDDDKNNDDHPAKN